jgi:hypothetical protein
LSELLCRHHQQKVIILIDEYDTPIHAGYHYGFYDEVVSFMRGLFGGLFKDNASLERGVITGIMRTAKEGIFSGLNNLVVRDVLDNQFSDKFGFTDGEVQQMLHDYELDGQYEQIKKWYNGYTIGETTRIYNPWSVLNCINKGGSLHTYWVNTSDNLVIKDLIMHADEDVQRSLEQMLEQQHSDPKELIRGIVFPDVKRCNEESLWSFLLFAGYITSDFTQQDSSGTWRYTLRIPNIEINLLYQQLIKEVFVPLIGSRIKEFLHSLITGDKEIVEELLQKFVMNSMSFYDVAATKETSTMPTWDPERSYHLFILGLLVLLQGRYVVESNREGGFGRYDIMLIPANPAKDAGVVIEFKRQRIRSETLEEAAHSALKQINDLQYAAKLHAHGCGIVYQYGIAFHKKEMMLMMQSLLKP